MEPKDIFDKPLKKDEFYRAIIRDHMEELLERIMELFDSSDDEVEKLRSFLNIKRESFRANAPMARIFFSESQGAPQNVLVKLDEGLRDKQGEFMRKLAAVFESGMARGRFRRVAHPYTLAIAIESATTGLLFRWIERSGECPGPDDQDAVLDIFIKGLLA